MTLCHYCGHYCASFLCRLWNQRKDHSDRLQFFNFFKTFFKAPPDGWAVLFHLRVVPSSSFCCLRLIFFSSLFGRRKGFQGSISGQVWGSRNKEVISKLLLNLSARLVFNLAHQAGNHVFELNAWRVKSSAQNRNKFPADRLIFENDTLI